jgi:hypothetical protein
MFQQSEMKRLKVLPVARLLAASLALSVSSSAYSNSGRATSAASSQVPAESSSTLQVDATPAGITPSSQYTARVNQHGVWTSSFVYQVQNPGFLPNGQPSGISSSSTLEHATSWTSFSFAGSVTVQVTNSTSLLRRVFCRATRKSLRSFEAIRLFLL